jgi:hypothetical protein
MRRRLAVAFALLAVPFVACSVAQSIVSLRVRFQDDTFSDAAARSTVGRQSLIQQLAAAPDGGPQALEGYTLIAHDRGLVRLAIGTIGNVEMNGAGDVDEIRSMQSGGVITNGGHVAHWTGHHFARPTRGPGYTGPINVDVIDYVTFDNGWAIRPSGERLLFCDPRGECRDVFAR